MQNQNLKNTIKIFYNKTLPYKKYQTLAKYFRKKRIENLIFCDHYPVITAGIQYKEESFKFPKEWLERKGIEIHYTQRGGDLTAHEKNQIIIYLHIDLKKRQIRISDFINAIVVITKDLIGAIFSISLYYNLEMPGLYTNLGEKIVSFGLEIKKGFTSSGLAINFTNDLRTFEYIHPCGYKDLKINSIKNLLLNSNKDYKIDDLVLEKKKNDFCKAWSERFLLFLDSYFL
ncbi:MAG: lipoyl(octanoyl) transferase LipB [Leptonema sp. (in: bacteria)]